MAVALPRIVFEVPSSLVLEIHFGEGGDDSKNFVDELLTAYLKYAQSKQFETELLNSDYGHKALKVTGIDVWEAFRYEPGKHVVQRVPENERGGRRHTSVVSVAVLPLPPETTKDRLPEKEVEITTTKGHGKGGQHLNTTDSAVRAHHLPSGIIVFINGRDQHQNKKLAMSILTAKVNLAKDKEAEIKYGIERREQLGNGGRGSKVRTYNLIDSFVKDHRTGKSVHRPKEIFAGRFELLQ